jgi:hypothetical protein
MKGNVAILLVHFGPQKHSSLRLVAIFCLNHSSCGDGQVYKPFVRFASLPNIYKIILPVKDRY